MVFSTFLCKTNSSFPILLCKTNNYKYFPISCARLPPSCASVILFPTFSCKAPRKILPTFPCKTLPTFLCRTLGRLFPTFLCKTQPKQFPPFPVQYWQELTNSFKRISPSPVQYWQELTIFISHLPHNHPFVLKRSAVLSYSLRQDLAVTFTLLFSILLHNDADNKQQLCHVYFSQSYFIMPLTINNRSIMFPFSPSYSMTLTKNSSSVTFTFLHPIS